MRKLLLWITAVSGIVVVLFALNLLKNTSSKEPGQENEQEHEAQEARFVQERIRYEFDMLKDPVTGKLPKDLIQREKAFALSIPEKTFTNVAARTVLALNSYIAAGPNNIGGRTRAVAFDRRFNGSSNRVIIAGCVSGGIMRSADGGTTWARVSPENEIHNLTALSQDPRAPDVWYAGGGEPIGNTAGEIGASYLGYGIYKSTNNGVTWTRLPLNTITNLAGTGLLAPGTLENFDHPFDYVHRIVINPLNSHLYIAGHRRLVRSTDGGATFRVVFETNVSAFSSTGQMDLAISGTGNFLLGVNGGAAVDRRGVWVSSTGDINSFTRIAGGSTLGVDSVAEWRGNSFTVLQPAAGAVPDLYSSKRILVALAPSNENTAYVYYENGEDAAPPSLKPEVDLYRLDISGNTYTWSNRSLNMPDFPGGNLSGSDPITTQGGYDMEVRVKPDDPNTVFIGGTNLYRSTDGFSSTANTSWIGGYRSDFTYGQYLQSHSDIHLLTFHPIFPNTAICANDGGVQITQDISAPTVSWTMLPNYQTLQCYNIAIDPTPGRYNFASGSQDNGVRYRDAAGIRGAVADSNNHQLLFSADGAYVGLSADISGAQYIYESIQFGRLYRARLTGGTLGTTEITPTGLTFSSSANTPNQFGEFVTNLRLEADNTDDLYYVNFNRLFRTASASTVTSSGWTELTGLGAAVNTNATASPRSIAIRGIGFSRGPYTPNKSLYVGTTDGKIFRLDDPRNVDPATAPANITPAGVVGNIQDIAVNPNDDNEVIAVVSNYQSGNTNINNIWWTNNAKSANPTWRQAEGNLASGLISARSCAIVVKRDASGAAVTEYYVGTGAGLYSTINMATVFGGGGNPTWVREGGNVLNLSVITSMAYRPADNVLLLGTHGNGLYYTNLGTPNLTTGIRPITNDRNFISAVYPTLSRNQVNYQTGNLVGIRNVQVQLLNMSGQPVLQQRLPYQNGRLNISGLPAGNYILQISSTDGRYRHVQKILRQ